MARRLALPLLVAATSTLLARCASAPPPSAASPPPRPPTRYDWIGVVGSGQSLSVGACGWPILSRSQPYGNLKLVDLGGAYPLDGGGAPLLVPLVEPIRAPRAGGDGQYPGNIGGETPHSALGNELSALALARGEPATVSLHSVVGWSAHCMRDIDKEGPGVAYPASLAEARAFAKEARVEHKTFAFAGVVLTHGECDSPSPTYEADLYRLWRDYDVDLRAITGQPDPVVLFASQQHSYPTDRSLPLSALAVWKAGRDYPGRIVCTGPKYQYAYGPDHVHFGSASYRRLGEKYAEVIDRVFVQHRPWAPLGPRSIQRDGTRISIAFDVPDPPLQWDETLAAPHQTALREWAKGRGFEVEAVGRPVPIDEVRIEGACVVVDLGVSPSGPIVVRYAMTQDGDAPQAGTELGRRGQLCDSDPLVGWDAQTVSCHVERGSRVVTATVPGALDARAPRDIVEAVGLPRGTWLASVDDGTHATLSEPWTGSSGEAPIAFRHDQRNYAVAFELEVP